MTKEELFIKCNVNESHSDWDEKIDNWYSVEIFRIMHGGRLPTKEDTQIKFIFDFLEKRKDFDWWYDNVMMKDNWGSLFLTAKRLIYKHSDSIISEINKQ